MATWGLESHVGRKFDNKKVKEVVNTQEGRDYLRILDGGGYNVTITDEVFERMRSIEEEQKALKR